MVIKLRSRIREEYIPANVIYESETELKRGEILPCKITSYDIEFKSFWMRQLGFARVKDEDSVELLTKDCNVWETLFAESINDAQKGKEYTGFDILDGRFPFSQRLRVYMQGIKSASTIGFVNKYYTEGELIWEPTSKERK